MASRLAPRSTSVRSQGEAATLAGASSFHSHTVGNHTPSWCYSHDRHCQPSAHAAAAAAVSAGPSSAHCSSSSSMNQMMEMFDLFDLDRDGRISPVDLAGVLEFLGEEADHEVVTTMFRQADVNEDGYVDFEEFLSINDDWAAWAGGMPVLRPAGDVQDELRSAFDMLDKDRDSFITAEDLHSVISLLWGKDDVSLEDCEVMIACADRDGDDRVSFDDFAEVMERHAASFAGSAGTLASCHSW